MLTNFSHVALFVIVAILFSLLLVILPIVFRFLRLVPHKPSPVKNATYECGVETIGKTWVQFNFRYYFYALMFVTLDVMVVFLYPWAVDLRQLGRFGFIGLLVFIFIIIIGYIYAWRKKVLEWK